MKNKVIDYLLVILLICITAMFAYSEYQNTKLNNVIDNQNTFITQVTGKQSEFDKESKKYRDSLTSYSKEITYLLNGKEINSSQFVKAYDRLADERDSLKEVISDLKFKYNLAKESYGFEIEVVQRKAKVSYSTVPYTKADSASMALLFFKDRLKRTKKGWSVDTTGPKDIEEIKRELKKVSKEAKAIVDSAEKNK